MEKGSEKLVLLGANHSEYGAFSYGSLGKACACLSVGQNPNSPSLAFKEDPRWPNEDALLVRTEGPRYLLAVADGHFGNQASHTLIERLSESPFPKTPEELRQTVTGAQYPEQPHSAGSTLLAAVLEVETGAGYGVNECHYRQPETSVQDSHISTLWEQTDKDQGELARKLTQLALDGVPGYPGGEDNIAVVALRT